MNLEKVLNASGVTIKDLRTAVRKEISQQENCWWVSGYDATIHYVLNGTASAIKRALEALGLPESLDVWDATYDVGYDAPCHVKSIMDELGEALVSKSEREAAFHHDLGMRKWNQQQLLIA